MRKILEYESALCGTDMLTRYLVLHGRLEQQHRRERTSVERIAHLRQLA